jgi:Cu2+-exporting ATPase
MRATDVEFGAVAELLDGDPEACAHCGLPVPEGERTFGAAPQFCCGGCLTAYEILHSHGLDRFYDLPERRGVAVRPSGRAYAEFDHPAFHALYVRELTNGLARVELYLEGVHCASCVWLVERVPMIVPGVVRAELQVRRSLVTIEWRPESVPLSSVARALDRLGYTPHPYRGVEREAMRRREDRAMLVRIGVAGAIAINVMLPALALYSGRFGGMDAEWQHFFRWVSFVLVTPAMLWPGRVFFAGALGALRARSLHMDVPIALGLAAGYIRGAMNTVQDSGPVYFDGLATLIFVLLVGRYLQQRGQRAAGDSAELLFAQTPTAARIVDEDDGVLRDVPAQALLPGMLLDVRAGEMFAADGRVERGDSQLDVSLLTGESRPERVGVGGHVFAGTLNLSGPLRVRVEAAGETSRVARIMRQVAESAGRGAPIVLLANRMAGVFVVVVVALAVLTFAIWQRIAPDRAWDNAIALLIVTCPCALALSTPLAVSVAIGRAARRGILIKGGDVIELLSRPSRLFVDKTGTITEARTALVSWEGPDWVREFVVALEAESSHPIAEAFRRAWPGLPPRVATSSTHTAGAGIEGIVGGLRITVGSPRFVASRSATYAEGIRASLGARADTGRSALTPVAVAVEGVVVALARIGDPVRPDSRAAISALGARGWRVGMLSGDDDGVVKSVAARVGVAPADCVSRASPESKRAAVERAKREGTVVMVGDGVNDAAAIAGASVGIGVHGGAEACLETADVYLTTPGLAPVVELVDGAARTMRVIRRNIAFSLVYNAVGATLAMTGVINPLVAAILMPASSLTVVITSWRAHTFARAAT